MTEYLRVNAITGQVDETAQRLGALQPHDMVSLQNGRVPGLGRIGLRPNLLVGPTLTNADAVLAAIGFGGKAIFLGWDQSASAVLLYEWNWSASSVTGKTFSDGAASAGKKWSTGVTSRLGISIAVFEDAVFICSTDRSKALAYYGIGDTNVSIVPALNLSAGTDDHIAPGGVAEFRNHLFTWGYQDEDTQDVSHCIRWSKPGTAKLAVDWVSTDYDYVGAEGETISGLVPVGDQNLVVLKSKSIHRVYGYKSSNFQLEELRKSDGCIGPSAWAELNGIVGFWHNEKCPALLVGSEVVRLDVPMRESLASRDLTAPLELWVAVEPQDQLFLFGAPEASENAPKKPLVYHAPSQRYLGYWDFPSTSLTTLREWFAVANLECDVLSGLAGPPSSLDADTIKGTSYRSTWINGDNSPGTVTIIERKEDAPTPGAYADASGEIPVADPSIYTHTVDEKHTYTARARHKKHGQETAVGDRPTKETLTKCDSAPISLSYEPPSGGQIKVTADVTARSGRAGAASTITLERCVKNWEVVKTWTGRQDQASPTVLQYSEYQPCGVSIDFRTKVTDEATTWPDSDVEQASLDLPSC